MQAAQRYLGIVKGRLLLAGAGFQEDGDATGTLHLLSSTLHEFCTEALILGFTDGSLGDSSLPCGVL